MSRHRSWNGTRFDLAPLAPATGPFAHRAFLETVTDFSGDADSLSVIETSESALAVVYRNGVVTLAGDSDLTDYHCPLGGDLTEVIMILVEGLEPGTEIDFDSLPEEAANGLGSAFENAGLETKVEQHAVAAVLTLPETWDDYLVSIGKKQRHEVRRKHRRYEAVVGELLHETHHYAGWGFDEFVRLHRAATGPKGSFMTADREDFFRRLLTSDGWRVDLLRVPGTDRAAACLFSYVDADGFYLYNSSYDPDLAEGSPGVAIVGSMIEQAIAEGIPRFDFLKGDEVYKFRLGAVPRPLMRLRAVV